MSFVTYERFENPSHVWQFRRAYRKPITCTSKVAGWKIFTVRNEVAKAMFLHLSVILFTAGGGGVPGQVSPRQVHTPREQVHPPGQVPLQDQVHPLQVPPRTGYPPGRNPPQDQVSSRTRYPPRSRDSYCCGRYASYWNAFLFHLFFMKFWQKSHVGPPRVGPTPWWIKRICTHFLWNLKSQFYCVIICLTRIHSSRMRTIRCSGRLIGGVCWGVSAQGGVPPVDRIRLWKHYLSATLFADGKYPY